MSASAKRPVVLLVLLGSLVLAVVGGELAFALFAPVTYHRPVTLGQDAWARLHRPGSVPGLEYELAPDAAVEIPPWRTTVHTNAHGLRGPAVERAKPAGVVRIAAVGDSFTFGHGVADDATFPSHLQALLDAEVGPGRFEVLNFGVSGYSSRDEAVVVRHKVLAFEPDLILVGYVLNDPLACSNQPVHLAHHETELWQRFHLTRLLARLREERGIERHGGWFRYLHGDPRHWSTVVEAFRDIAAAAGDVPVALVLMPLVDHTRWKGYPQADLHAQVAAEGEANGFAVLDLRVPLAKLAPTPRSLRLPEDAHASDEGNRLIAQAILEFARGRWPELFPQR